MHGNGVSVIAIGTVAWEVATPDSREGFQNYGSAWKTSHSRRESEF